MKRPSLLILTGIITFVMGVALAYAYWLRPDRRWVPGRDRATTELTSPPLDALPANPADLEALRQFAESYQPRSTAALMIPSPPNLKGRTLTALQNLIKTGGRAHEKYVVLIILRLFRFRYANFVLTYDLYDEPPNPLTGEFLRLVNADTAHPPEGGYGPSLAVHWVRSHQTLRSYEPISKEMELIERAREKWRKEFESSSRRD